MKLLFFKVIRDLLKDKFKGIMALIAMIFGITAFGIALFTYQLINTELSDGFAVTAPSSATVTIDGIDDKLVELTGSFKEFDRFEEKGFYVLRLKVGEKWKTLNLYAIKDFKSMQVNKVFPEKGSFNPGKGEVLIERDALGVGDTDIGRMISIMLPDSKVQDLKVTGIVHDMNTHPASVENVIPVYISYDTLESLGLSGNRIDFILTQNKYEKASILAAGNDYMNLLESQGYKVKGINVLNDPGKTIHQTEYDAVLLVLGVVAFLAFILGCLVMSSLLSSILSSQVRQIGILKSIGGNTRSIFLAYMSVILALVAVTIAIATPLSIMLSRSFSALLLGLGNMDLTLTDIPVNLIAVFFALELIVPIIAAFVPIRRGIVVTVKEALHSYGLTRVNTAGGRLFHGGTAARLLSRPVLLSTRNAVLRKGRFYLNLGSLTLGGALFIAAITSIFAMGYTINKDLEHYTFNYQINTSKAVDEARLTRIISQFPEVQGYESWGNATGKIIYKDGEAGNLYSIMAPAYNTGAFKPNMLEGRWLSEGDTGQVVVGHQFFSDEDGYKVGDSVTLRIGNQEQQLQIVGKVRELGPATFYMNKPGFEQLIPADGKRNSVKLVMKPGVQEEASLYQKIEDKMKDDGVSVFQAHSMADLLEVMKAHGILVVVFSLVIAIMILVVAGFGLTSTMSVQVAERTKEIGIMKAIGASRKQIKRIVTAESVFICFVSWGLSIILGILFGNLMAYGVGNLMFHTSLNVDYSRSYIPITVWLVLSFILGYAASRTAAKRAAAMTVKNALVFD